MTRWIPILLLLATPSVAQDAHRGLTAVEGLLVGHHTIAEKPTGCTVVLTGKDGAVAAVDVRGGAPATKETDLLDPTRHVARVHAIVLTGGSAFGLDTTTGVMRYLEERGIGYPVGRTVVPIVPAASLNDLGMGGQYALRPGPECGYAAASAASDGPVPEGNVGAGAGATVGKYAGRGRGMKGGLGSASFTSPDGLVVAAIVATNPAGDVIDPTTNAVVAGARTEDGLGLVDARKLLRAGPRNRSRTPGGERDNTTIGIIATNAILTQVEALKVAQMAHDGYGRAMFPAHTSGDGDAIFALATGRWRGDEEGWRLTSRIGALASELMAEAIVRSVTQAESLPGWPAVRDLGKDPDSQ